MCACNGGETHTTALSAAYMLCILRACKQKNKSGTLKRWLIQTASPVRHARKAGPSRRYWRQTPSLHPNRCRPKPMHFWAMATCLPADTPVRISSGKKWMPCDHGPSSGRAVKSTSQKSATITFTTSAPLL